MRFKILTGALIIAALPLAAKAATDDCFPVCAPAAPVEVKVNARVDAMLETFTVVSQPEASRTPTPRNACEAGFMKQADDLNDTIKPLKELAGYVRSPQGLAVKLVNDHVVKIPPWIGYALDPLGSIKGKAFEQVRARARDALNDGRTCLPAPSGDASTTPGTPEATDAIDAKHSV